MRFRELNDKYDTTNVRWGIVRTNNLSNELDSATIVLTNVSKLDIEPYDIIELTNENDELEFWLVGNVEKEYLTYQSPFSYEYTIDLVSLTRLLEVNLLPNMTITNIGQNRDISFYIDKVYNRYFKSHNLYKNKITLSYVVNENKKVNEYVFQGPTLREFLDALYGQISCISKLEMTKVSENNYNLKLVGFDLNKDEGPLPLSYVDNIKGSYSMENYITSIHSNSEQIINPLDVVEYHKLRSSEIITNTDNVKLFVDNKIYDLIKVVVKNVAFRINGLFEVKSLNGYFTNSNDTPFFDFSEYNTRPVKNINFMVGIPYTSNYIPGYPHSTDNGNYSAFVIEDKMDLDITSFIKPLEIFNTLTTLKQGEIKDRIGNYFLNNYKNNTLYFSRGENVIENICYYERQKVLWWDIVDEPALQNAISCAALRWIKKQFDNGVYNWSYQVQTGSHRGETVYVSYFIDKPAGATGTFNDASASNEGCNFGDYYKDLIFEFKYKPYVSTKIICDKSDSKHLVSANEGNNNVLTDVSSSLSQVYEKVKQLANDNLVMVGYSPVENDDFNPVFKVGQRFNDEDNNNYVLSKLEYQTDKNSIKYKGTLSKDYSNKILTTIINREKRYYAYANVSEMVERREVVKKKLVVTTTNSLTGMWWEHNRSHRILFSIPIGALFAINTGEGSIYGYIPVNVIRADEIISYNFKFLDNISYAEIASDETIAGAGGYLNKIKKYVNSQGEFQSISYYFTEDISYIDAISNYEYDYRIPTSTMGIINITKDNREQIAINHQIELVFSDNIVVHKINWNDIYKNGGIDHIECIYLVGIFANWSDNTNVSISSENVSELFEYDFASHNNGFGVHNRIFIHDKSGNYYRYLDVNVPNDYTGSMYLHSELIDKD